MRDYGAVGNGTVTAIGTTYGSTLAALASYATAAGAQPFTWATNPLFGLTGSYVTTSSAAGGATSLNFAEAAHNNPGDGPVWTVSYLAPWQDPNSGTPSVMQPGQLISGPCGNNTVAGVAYTNVIQGEQLPGSVNWAPGIPYSTQNLTASFQGDTMTLSASATIPAGAVITSGAVLPYRFGVPAGTGTSFTVPVYLGTTGSTITATSGMTLVNIAVQPVQGTFVKGQTIVLTGIPNTLTQGITFTTTINGVNSTQVNLQNAPSTSGNYTVVTSIAAEPITVASEVFANGGFYKATSTGTGTSGSLVTNAAAGGQATFAWNGTNEIMTVTSAPSSGAFAAGDLLYGPNVPTGTAITSGGGTSWTLNTPADQQFVAGSASMVNANLAGPAGGATVSDGGVTWTYLKPVESENLYSGVVYLVSPQAASCASGSAITLTMPPARLQASTTDWLGVQTAIAQAYFNPTGAGGKVDLGAGELELNQPLYNPGGFGGPAVTIVGNGADVSQLIEVTDLGQDRCALGDSNRSAGSPTGNIYDSFRVSGPGNYTTVVGLSPNRMDGLCVGNGAKVYNVKGINARAGLNLVGSHQIIRSNTFSNNGYGVLFAELSPNIGNQLFDGGNYGGSIAGMGIASTNVFDSGQFLNAEIGYSYSGIYHIPLPTNVTAGYTTFLHADTFSAISNESLGGPFIQGTDAGATVNNVTFVGLSAETSVPSSLQLSDGNGGLVPDPAFIHVAGWNGINAYASSLANVGQFGDAVIEVSGACNYNHYYDDIALISGISGVGEPSLAHPAMICGAGSTINVDTTSQGNYEFHTADPRSQVVFAGYSGIPVYPQGNGDNMDVFVDGAAVAGFTANLCAVNATSATVNTLCPIQVSGNVQVPGNTTTTMMYQGNPAVVTAMGFANNIAGVVQGLDGAGASGTILGVCTTSCTVRIGPAGASSSAQTNLTPGTSVAPSTVQARYSEYRGAGGYVQMPIWGVQGDVVTICNDGTASITLSILSYPNADGTTETGTFKSTGAATATLANGSCGTYHRIDGATWF